MSRENLLMVADSEHDANMLYAVGMFAPTRSFTCGSTTNATSS
jgi:hypothetical protein